MNELFFTEKALKFDSINVFYDGEDFKFEDVKDRKKELKEILEMCQDITKNEKIIIKEFQETNSLTYYVFDDTEYLIMKITFFHKKNYKEFICICCLEGEVSFKGYEKDYTDLMYDSEGESLKSKIKDTQCLCVAIFKDQEGNLSNKIIVNQNDILFIGYDDKFGYFWDYQETL